MVQESLNGITERIRHEEKLIDGRLTWMLTFQGFLFTSLALAADTSMAVTLG